MTTRNGHALPLTLAAIIVIALVAAIAAEQVRSSTRTISALSDQIRYQTALISAEQTLIYELLTEPMTPEGVAIGSQTDITLLAMGANASTLDSAVVRANGQPYQVGPLNPVIIRLYDDQTFLNAASSDPAYVSDVLSLFDIPRTDHSRYAAALRDYQDEDDLRALSGAEASDYDQPGLPTNKPLRDALELCAVKYWETSPICDDPARVLLTMRTRRSDRLNPGLSSEALLSILMPHASAEAIAEAHANYANRIYTRFGDIGADTFDVNRDPLSTLSAPGPIVTLISHTPDASVVQRTVIGLTPNSLISPFVVHSKYAIGGDYAQNLLRIERLDDVAPLPQPTSIRTER
jgi:type II secretory pathway pseudopilin PulG